MKRFVIIILIAALATTAFAERQVIREFTVSSEDQRAILQWNTRFEAGVSSFKIERGFEEGKFHNIAVVDPIGNNQTYRYVDTDLFKGQMQTYYYRIAVIMTDGGKQYSPTKWITLVSSSIHRTWGSIKAMFR